MQDEPKEQQLTWLQERALEDAYDDRKKKLWLAYLLAVPLGCIGVHRFYLGRRRTGLLMMGIWLMGFLITWIIAIKMPDRATTALWSTAAGLLMLSMWVWEVVDFFLISVMLRKFNSALEAELAEELRAGRAV